MRKIIRLILTSSFVSSLIAQPDTLEKYDFFKKYSVYQQQEDLRILKTVLEKTHPGLYWYTTKEAFEHEYKKIFDNIKIERTEYQFSNYVLPLLAQVHCSHTSIRLSDKGQKYKSENATHFPVDVKIIANKIYVKQDYSDDNIYSKGTEILSINRIESRDLLSKLVKSCWVDGNNLQGEFSSVESQFIKLMDYRFDYPSAYSIETRIPNGRIIRKNKKAVPLSKINNQLSKTQIKGPNQYFSLIDSLSTAVLTFNNFVDTGFAGFVDHSFQTIKDKNVQNLIIDLRKNGGGFDLYGVYLYSYIALSEFNYYDHLEITVTSPSDSIFKHGYFDNEELIGKQQINKALKRTTDRNYYVTKDQFRSTSEAPFPPEKNAFTSKLYILISNKTFSGASEFCAIARSQMRAKFIGQETGGGYCGNSSGSNYNLVLPNTKVNVNIPLVRYLSAINNCQSMGGIKPDFEIVPDINDLMTKTDREIKFTLDLIKTLTKH